MNTIEITIDTRPLRACRLFASNDDMRYQLCGVRVYIAPEHTTYVATDGRMLLAVRDSLDPSGITVEPFTVPNALVDSIDFDATPIRGHLAIGAPDQYFTDRRWIGFYNLDRSELVGLREVGGSEVSGTFPDDWRKVVPSGPLPRSSDAFDFKRLGILGEAAGILGGQSYGRLYGEPRSAHVALLDEVKAFSVAAVIMPVKEDKCITFGVPAWAEKGGEQ
jgi:hypothetical protein